VYPLSPGPWAYDSDRPNLATVLSAIAGALTIAGGFFLINASPTVVASCSQGWSPLCGQGSLGILLGFLMFVPTAVMFIVPRSHLASGAAMVVLTLLALLGGGLFAGGTFFGILGGISAIRYTPPRPLPPELRPLGTPLPKHSRSCSFCEVSLEPGDVTCPNCGHPVSREGPG
jgi:hypothetical protein